MKIAAVTDDGTTVGRHFGQATGYVVYTVENGRIAGREVRAKPACAHSHGHEHAEAAHEEPAGNGGERDLHSQMTDVIADCEAVVARRIPPPMFRHLVATGIRPLVTDILLADDAINAFLAAEALRQ